MIKKKTDMLLPFFFFKEIINEFGQHTLSGRSEGLPEMGWRV